LQQQVFNLSPAAGDLFGSAVAINGTYIAIGAPNDDNSGSSGVVILDQGTVNIFHIDAVTNFWLGIQDLASSSTGGPIAGHYGSVLSISADYLIAGSNKLGGGISSSNTSIYKKNSFGFFDFLHVLPPVQNTSYSFFETKSVSISNGLLAVGLSCSAAFINGPSSIGRVNFYHVNLAGNWVLFNSFNQETPPDNNNRQLDDGFGSLVSISEDYCLVNYILFKKTGDSFYKLQKIVDPATNNLGANSIAVDGINKRFVIGILSDTNLDHNGSYSGKSIFGKIN
jgi:hypothetical protein